MRPPVRPHGISLPIFPRLPAWFTSAGYGCLLDFAASCQLILRKRLNIRFLSVRLQFRYPFFSPTPHDANLGSRFGVRRQLRPTWTFTTDWRHARHTRKPPAFIRQVVVILEKIIFPSYTIHNPHVLIRTPKVIQFFILHQNWILFWIILNCILITFDSIVLVTFLIFLSSGNRIWTGNLRVMGPAIFHLIISRDWKRQIRTAPHAPRARVLPLHHVLKIYDYEGNWTLTPRETIWYANHYATQPFCFQKESKSWA